MEDDPGVDEAAADKDGAGEARVFGPDGLTGHEYHGRDGEFVQG